MSAERTSYAQQTTSSKSTRGRGKPWSKEEDEAICCSWLDVSQDPIISINQKTDTMYNRILAKFLEICADKDVIGDYQSRTVQAIKSRWANISRSVSKFVGCLNKVENLNQSGASPADNFKKALVLFKSDTGGHFNLTHCYVILSVAPKWKQQQQQCPTGTTESTAAVLDTTPEPSSQPSQPTEDPLREPREEDAENQPSANDIASRYGSRPIGQKRAKIEAAYTESFQVTLREIADSGKRLIELTEKRLHDGSKRTEAYKRMINHKIMSVDFSKLSPVAQIFYEHQQQKILEECEQQQMEEARSFRFSELENNSQISGNVESTYGDGSQCLVSNQNSVNFNNAEILSNLTPRSQEDLDALNISYSPEQISE